MALPLVTSIAAALAVFMASAWYVLSRTRVDARLRALGERNNLIAQSDDPISQRVFFPIVDGVVQRIMSVMPGGLLARLRRALIVAGDGLSAPQFLTIVLLTSTLLPFCYIIAATVVTEGDLGGYTLLPAFVLGGLGVLAPLMVLRRAAKRRQEKVWRSMPNALDLLTTCVEAGLSLDFGLQRVADRYRGPLADEIHRALREVGLGKTRREALLDLAERVQLPDLATFVNSIVQAEALGTSVGQVLRTQAQQLRTRRRQRAEQMARRAPVKMVFPLVFFLLPSLFIVTLGPVVLYAIKAFQEN